MKEFKRFYVWGLNAKLYMGIYFTAIVFVGGLLTFLFGGEAFRLVTLLQMLIVSIIIALAQVFLLPDSADFSHRLFFGRSVCWLAICAVLVTAAALLCGWFAGLPAWCPWLMGTFMLIGCAAMLVGFRFEQQADTLRLNESLSHYQKDGNA